MLKNFLKKDIDSNDPEIRLQGVKKLDPSNPEHQQKLISVLRSDPEESVRLAAVPGISDIRILAEFAVPNANDQTSQATKVVESLRSSSLQRLESMLMGEPELSESDINYLLTLGAPDLISLVASHSSNESTRTVAIERLTNETDLAGVVVSSKFHTSRQQAASRLSSEKIMESCVAKIRTRDKIVARQLQERLDAGRVKKQKETERLDEIKLILSAITDHSSLVWSPSYPGRLSALTDRWNQISPSPGKEELSQFEKAHSICKARIKEHQEQQQVLDYCSEAVDQLSQIQQEMATYSLSSIAKENDGIKKRLEDISVKWASSAKAAEPAQELSNKYISVQKEIQKQIDEADQLLGIKQKFEEQNVKTKGSIDIQEIRVLLNGIPASVAELDNKTEDCQWLVEAKDFRRSLESKLKQQQNIDADRLKAVQKQLGALGGLIKNGKWSASRSLYIRIEKKIKLLDGHRSHKSLLDQLAKHKIKIDELADWQDFAAKPKLELLCDQMEKLADEKLSPVEKGKKIKLLQNQWKEVGSSRVSSELWDRFKLASDKAYEPVGEFQKLKREERESKKNNKKQICDELNKYLESVNWEEANWKNVEKTLRVAKSEWSKNRVKDRKPEKDLEENFTQLVGSFNEKLSEQYDLNAAIKEELLNKVLKLESAEVNQHTVNQTRRLQNSWKQTGIMRRRQDQELWVKFNGACREIYKRHGKVQREKTQSELAHVHEAKSIIRTIKGLAQENEPDEKKCLALQDVFSKLPEFPEKDKKGILRDFNKATDQFSRVLEKSSLNTVMAEHRELVRRSQLCEQYESLVADKLNADDENHNNALSGLDAEWDSSDVVLSRSMAAAVNKRREIALKHLNKGTSYDYALGEDKRRMLCIKAEILAGLETPAEDKALRMAYQLENLQQGMGASSMVDSKSALQELAMEWLILPPASQINRDTLSSRFKSAMAKIGIDIG